jgi:imidazole glycerol-phosphate synthase subunit HisH
MIDVLDYGLGNLSSVIRMITKAGGSARRIAKPEEVAGSTKLIIPGVGHFDWGMQQIKERGLFEPLKLQALDGRIPILGICLGMQLLCSRSEEGVTTGLNFVDAEVRKFRPAEGEDLRVPHMGWCPIRVSRSNPLIVDSPEEQRFYFVHSYYVLPRVSEITIATARYGIEFCAAFQSENIFGVQFHPEKSHRFGMALMRQFVEL